MSEVEKYKKFLLGCRFCWMCRHICPVSNITKKESDTPRGLALMIYRVYSGAAEYTQDMIDSIYRCTVCGRCKEWCISSYDLPALVLAARRDIVDMGLAPSRALEQKEAVTTTGNPFSEDRVDEVLEKELDQAPEKGDLLYFLGCETRYRRPEVALAFIELMKKAGINFAVVREEKCCGKPLTHHGFQTDADALSKEQVEMLKASGAKRVVFSCPSCLYTFDTQYGLEGIELLTAEEVMVEMIDSGKLKLSKQLEGPAAVFDPCYTSRYLQDKQRTRELLGTAELKEMRWAKGRSLCCGGEFDQVGSELSKEMSGEIVRMAEDISVKTVVTSCPTCKSALMKAEEKIEVTDITEIIKRLL